MKKLFISLFAVFFALATPASAATGPISTTGSSCGFGIVTIQGQQYIYAHGATALTTPETRFYDQVYIGVSLSKNDSLVNFVQDSYYNANSAYITTGDFLFDPTATYKCTSLHRVHDGNSIYTFENGRTRQ
ncbi:hypothetical protein NYE54_09415 [Paenibacillus sp. FSL K6-1330]|uniref:hypothetical protein n=1 Tax=Paenibacillus sp. FSL K6-1330 TaxID=2975292 RepID=UPI0030DC7713